MSYVGVKLRLLRMALQHTRLAFVVASLSTLFFGACEKGLQWKIPPVNLEVMPFAPLEVAEGVQTVYLDAYWGDISQIDSITLSPGFRAHWLKGTDTVLLRTAQHAPPLGKMRFWAAGYAYTLPLIRKVSPEHIFSLPDPEQRHASVNLITSFSAPRTMLFENGRWYIKALVPEGIHMYGFQPDGSGLRKDPLNPDSIYWPGLGMGSLIPYAAGQDKQNSCRTLAFTATQVRLSRDPAADACLVLWNNIEIPFDTTDGALRLEIPKEARKVPVSYLRVWLYNKNSIQGACKIPLVKGIVPIDTGSIPSELWDAALRYELMTDRFFNGDSSNDRKRENQRLLHPKSDFWGGDFAGVAAKIREGYFRELGVSFLQISPPARNDQKFLATETTTFGRTTAYHGRYPVSASETEPGFGSAGDLTQLLQLARTAGVSMGLEPPGSLPFADGGTHDLPVDSALSWFRTFNAAAWMHVSPGSDLRRAARMAAVVRRFGKEENGRNLFLAMDGYLPISTYTANVHAAVNAYTAPDFHALAFTMFAFQNGNSGWAEQLLGRYLRSMNNLQLRFHSTGGEQLPRFISLADGSLNPAEDPQQAGWSRDIQNKGATYFSRLQSLFAFCCALPGIPGMYYGDEIAMPGGGPPDNHRVMHFDGLSSVQTEHRDAMARLARFRRTHPVLMFGDVRVVPAAPGILAVERNFFGRIMFAVFNLQEHPASFQIPIGLNRSFRGAKIQPDGKGVKIQLEPNSYDFIY